MENLVKSPWVNLFFGGFSTFETTVYERLSLMAVRRSLACLVVRRNWIGCGVSNSGIKSFPFFSYDASIFELGFLTKCIIDIRKIDKNLKTLQPFFESAVFIKGKFFFIMNNDIKSPTLKCQLKLDFIFYAYVLYEKNQ